MMYFLFDQHLQLVTPAVLPIQIRGVKFGIGCFETMYFNQGKIRLGNLHFERLNQTLNDLKISLDTIFNLGWIQDFLQKQLDPHFQWRVRLTVYNAAEEYSESISQGYISIEAKHLYPQKKEIRVGVIQGFNAKQFNSKNYKLLNYHPYIAANDFAKQNGWDDVLLFNDSDHLIESSIANVFIVQKYKIFTPPLSTGAVKGVMRNFILQGWEVEEKIILLEDLKQASEIFLSNALGIRSMLEWNNKILDQSIANNIRSRLNEI